jgi:hypothetical protein
MVNTSAKKKRNDAGITERNFMELKQCLPETEVGARAKKELYGYVNHFSTTKP